MTDTKLYSADFYRAEIERVTLLLSQPIAAETRKHLHATLDAARKYLAEIVVASYRVEIDPDVQPVLIDAPTPQIDKFDACYTIIRGARPGKRIGLVKYNEKGYYQTDFDERESNVEQVEAKVEWLNARLGIPADVVESMQFASMFGWDAPIADRAHAYFKNNA